MHFDGLVAMYGHLRAYPAGALVRVPDVARVRQPARARCAPPKRRRRPCAVNVFREVVYNRPRFDSEIRVTRARAERRKEGAQHIKT